MSLPGLNPVSAWEACTLANSYSNSVSIALRNIYMSPRHGSPQCMWLHDHTKAAQGCRPNSTRKPVNPEYWHHLLSSKTDHVGVTTMERLDQGRIHPSYTRCPETDMSRLGLNPASGVGGKYSSKELFEQRIISYSVHLLYMWACDTSYFLFMPVYLPIHEFKSRLVYTIT